MAKAKTPTHKVVMTEGKREIIRNLLSEYDIQSAQDIQEALKDLLGGTIKELMEGHLGYEKSCPIMSFDVLLSGYSCQVSRFTVPCLFSE